MGSPCLLRCFAPSSTLSRHLTIPAGALHHTYALSRSLRRHVERFLVPERAQVPTRPKCVFSALGGPKTALISTKRRVGELLRHVLSDSRNFLTLTIIDRECPPFSAQMVPDSARGVPDISNDLMAKIIENCRPISSEPIT